MSDTTIWHNPRCTKSRETLKLLQDEGVEPTVRLYLDDIPSAEELRDVLAKLGFASVRDWMRNKEAAYREAGLKDESDEDKLIAAMIENPKLIERPVIIRGEKAVLGRPPVRALDLF